jgi:hypothetical protein
MSTNYRPKIEYDEKKLQQVLSEPADMYWKRMNEQKTIQDRIAYLESRARYYALAHPY